ncbi:hypothetical protein [Nocardioides daeguensis]|uniref:hypothetical protein n=1 Tax=Nocardioides daeguensis TaxID=908359 RepID=UPI001C474BBB|nr:hypothetical protein [Nocardioides daeguensis]MBV6727852.1 hypothetical protein [Nocardioides daeguensis]MCR1775323.1 hypothetical protein [Nocardioides daeguensis]
MADVDTKVDGHPLPAADATPDVCGSLAAGERLAPSDDAVLDVEKMMEVVHG